MTLNLDKNRESLISAWKEVLDEKSDTNWALLGYDGQTFDLNLVAKGDGLDELADEFNSGKIQYALARVSVKEKNVEKIVLINWQGEGAPLSRKGMCANHIAIVRSFFKGIHVTMNARTDEEVDPDLIIQAVSKAISGDGVKMSSNIENDAPVGPVGTCYKRTNPREEINTSAKDDFWKKEEQEEERRKREEQNKHRKFSQNEVKLLRRESQDYFNDTGKEVPINNSMNKISPTPPTINGSNGTTNGKLNGSINGSNGTSTNGSSSNSSPVPPKEMAAASAAAVKASTPLRNNTSSDLVRQRIRSFDNGAPPQSAVNGTNGNKANGGASEAESLSVSKRRQLFESGGASNITSTVVRRNPSLEIKEAQKSQVSPATATVTSEETPAPMSNSVPTTTPIISNSNNSGAPPTLSEEKVAVVGCGIQRSASPQVSPPPIPQPSLSPVPPVEPQPVPIISAPTVVPMKAINRPSESPARSPVPPVVLNSPARASPPVPPSASSPQPVITAVPPGFEDSVEDQPESIEQTETITIEITPEMGLCARALYDYQAGKETDADDTEITFDPGEIITNIERIDEGWWEGLCPRGVYGLFPANYVELLN
ncbi:Drebrin-like protein [Orchesella cincta]|uniref:Drebrin-like protein n=1 Tax=Orchesella cincta TaxID=48709 RepID=A0A1D2N6K2_ORCCI|nr:Drebrin-like protein [Orchesella cincta]